MCGFCTFNLPNELAFASYNAMYMYMYFDEDSALLDRICIHQVTPVPAAVQGTRSMYTYPTVYTVLTVQSPGIRKWHEYVHWLGRADFPAAMKRKASRDGKAAANKRKALPSFPTLQRNELLERWRANRRSLPPDFERLLDPELDNTRRGDLFEAEDEDAMERFAWAIPDARALRACAAFAPLVEMGAGAGYWARLLHDMGVEIEAFDKDVGAATRAAGMLAAPWTHVARGGPEQLLHERFSRSTLLLIYPDDLGGCRSAGEHEDNEDDEDDDDEDIDDLVIGRKPDCVEDAGTDDDDYTGSSGHGRASASADSSDNARGASASGGDDLSAKLPLSLASLEAFQGDTVIHVGEWLGETKTLSMENQSEPDIPYAWGRSTDPRFQTTLAARFHKILQLPLPNWGTVSNSLTVWRRTRSVVIEGDRYAHIPFMERIQPALAAPCVRHLLAARDDDNGACGGRATKQNMQHAESTDGRLTAFLHLAGQLKQTVRTGWVDCGVPHAESVADHSWRMSLVAMLLCTDDNEGTGEATNGSAGARTDRAKCMQMAIVHDLAESLCGDITPVENSGVTKKEKQRREREAMEHLCSALGGAGSARARLISGLWEEYEAGVTPEAQLVKDIDKFEMLLQADEYERANASAACSVESDAQLQLQDFFDTTAGKVKTRAVRSLELLLRQLRDARAAKAKAVRLPDVTD